MSKIAIITGATGGFGSEFVKQILQQEVEEVWAIARKEQKLVQLKQQYGDKIIAVSADLANQEGIEKLSRLLEERKPDIRYLINNAGLGMMGESKNHSLQEASSLIDVNCKAPVLMCILCIPYMKKGSRILNISSASSFQPNPYINLYAASKVFERSYSRALNRELVGTGITVTAVCPGWVDTELIPKEINGKKVKFPGLVNADRVVELAIKDANKGKDMSVCSFYVKYLHVLTKLVPQSLIMNMWEKQIKQYVTVDK